MTEQNMVNIIQSALLPLPDEFESLGGLRVVVKGSPLWYRARFHALLEFVAETPYKDQKINSDITLLLNGVLPQHDPGFYNLEKKINQVVDRVRTIPEYPLKFSEMTRFNTWFEMHPDKVFGKEIVTTSVQFPISIKGNRATIEEGFARFIKPVADAAKPKRNSRARTLALALEIELKLRQRKQHI
jgi:hypothetical protein